MSEHDFTPFRRELSTSKMKTRAFTDDELNRLRATPCERVFEHLEIYYKMGVSIASVSGYLK